MLDPYQSSLCEKSRDTLLSCGSSASAVPMPTRMASCSERSLASDQHAFLEAGRRWGIPVGHEHALWAAEGERCAAHAADFGIEGLRESEGDVWACRRWGRGVGCKDCGEV